FPEFEVGRVCRRPSFLPIGDVPCALKFLIVRGAALSPVLSPLLLCSQVPLGKRLREYFNSEKPEGRIIMTRVQKMNWKNVYYKFLEITISEARCLELHMEVDWIPIAHSKPTGGNVVQYLLPGGIPKSPGLYAIGYEECIERPLSPDVERQALDPGKEGRVGLEALSAQASLQVEIEPTRIIYCYLGIAELLGKGKNRCMPC
ncbi:hypothetical protein A6R68_23757, partial [Neotoma lepida]